MPHVEIAAEGKVWLYEGPGGWHFVTLPEAAGRTVRELSVRNGWGSVRVTVTIGTTTWETSVFPDKRSGSYLLPIKKEVRDRVGISSGDRIRFTLGLDP